MEVKILALTTILFVTATIFIAVWLDQFFEIGGEKEQQVAEQLLLEYPIRRLAEFCSNVSLDCYVIYDTIQKVEGKMLALRVIREKVDAGLAISDARLHIPKPMTYKTLDTRKWKVDKNYVYMKYAQTMASGVFFSQAVEYNSVKESKILMIGLGGGIISGYLSSRHNNTFDITIVELDPIMKTIAEAYFQVKESEKLRIVIEDGIDFIKRAAEENRKYDAILVDANVNKMAAVVAPPPSFLNDNPISDFSKCLSEKGVVSRNPRLCKFPGSMSALVPSDVCTRIEPTLIVAGVVVVNVITPEMHKEAADKVLKLFEKHFKFCKLVPSGSYQRMLFCFNYEHPWSRDPNLLKQHIMDVDHKTGFHLLDGRRYLPED